MSWEDKKETTFEDINTSMIYKDAYQRPLEVNRVKKIVKQFNPNLVNLIKVSLRDGKYWVFDGQHTMAALKMRNDNKDLVVECRVYHGMTYEEEALAFADQNGVSKKPSTLQELKARYESKDIDVLDFVEALGRYGIVCDFSRSAGANKLVAYTCAFSIYEKTRKVPSKFEEVLNILTSAYYNNPYALRKEMISAVYLFVNTYWGQYSTERAIKQFAKISPLTVIREGNISKTNGPRKYAFQLVAIYNKNLSANRINEDLLWKPEVR